MATPMSSTQIVAQLKKWGVPFKEYKSWKTHNRNSKGAWGPVNGFMVHHTGSDSKDQRELLYAGISGLPGPLCHFGLAQDGTVHLVGWGRANHAGSGDPDVLNAVINENYGANPPADNQSSVDGNARFYGVEIWYSGSHAMTAAQYATLRKLAAAICDFHKWSEKSVIGHGEWGSPGKWDPGISSGKMMDMAKVRADIKATLAGTKPAPKPPTPTTPTTGTYTVKKGDTLWSISQALKLDVADLKAWNGLKTDAISIGQVLKTKKPASTPPKPTTPPVTPKPWSGNVTPKSRESAETIKSQTAAALAEWPFIPEVERANALPEGLLFAVGSRETNLKNVIGDGGHGFGVWQRDNRTWPVDETYLNDVRKQADDAASLLQENYKALKNWSLAIGAYNAGPNAVKNAAAAGKSPDSVTTDGNYVADVLGRLQSVPKVPIPNPPTLEERVTNLENRIAELEKE